IRRPGSRRCATGYEAGGSLPSRPPLVPHGRRESLRWIGGLRGQGIMEADSGTPASVMHTAVEHWKVSATGERLGQGANRGFLVVGGARGRRYSRPRRTRDGRRR